MRPLLSYLVGRSLLVGGVVAVVVTVSSVLRLRLSQAVVLVVAVLLVPVAVGAAEEAAAAVAAVAGALASARPCAVEPVWREGADPRGGANPAGAALGGWGLGRTGTPASTGFNSTAGELQRAK